MMRYLVPAGLAAILLPAAIAFVTGGNVHAIADPKAEPRLIAQAPASMQTPAPVSNDMLTPDPMPEAGATPTPASAGTPTPAVSPSPAPNPAAAAATINAPPATLTLDDKLNAAKSAGGQKTPEQIDEEIKRLEKEMETDKKAPPSTNATETGEATTNKSRRPLDGESDEADSGRVPERRNGGGIIADLAEGSNLTVTGTVLSVRPAENQSMRAELETRAGERVVALIPPWPGMRIPAIGGTLRAECKKLKNSGGKAVVRVIRVENVGRPAPRTRGGRPVGNVQFGLGVTTW